MRKFNLFQRRYRPIVLTASHQYIDKSILLPHDSVILSKGTFSRIVIRMGLIRKGALIGLGALIGIGALFNNNTLEGALIRKGALTGRRVLYLIIQVTDAKRGKKSVHYL